MSRSRRFVVVMGVTALGLTLFARLMGAPAQKEVPSPDGLPSINFRGSNYSVYEVDPKKQDLRLFWQDAQGRPLRDFADLGKAVAAQGERLVFAANAGMFETDLRPVGLLVQEGKEVTPLNLKDASGNFYLKPNGVFLINEKKEARIVESGAYAAELSPAVWATQSGPMLVLRGDIHPEFNADSKNVNIRSGVGVRKDGVIEFVLSRRQVNFYDFALFFRDRLKCPNALFLDGTISAFQAQSRQDAVPHEFGPMIGVVEKLP